MSFKPGIYASINGEWLPLRPEQVEAFENCKEKHGKTMYSMGGLDTSKFYDNFGVNSKGTRYAIKIGNNLNSGEIFMQLGDGLFHQIIEIKAPPPPQPAKYFEGSISI